MKLIHDVFNKKLKYLTNVNIWIRNTYFMSH